MGINPFQRIYEILNSNTNIKRIALFVREMRFSKIFFINIYVKLYCRIFYKLRVIKKCHENFYAGPSCSVAMVKWDRERIGPTRKGRSVVQCGQ